MINKVYLFTMCASGIWFPLFRLILQIELLLVINTGKMPSLMMVINLMINWPAIYLACDGIAAIGELYPFTLSNRLIM